MRVMILKRMVIKGVWVVRVEDLQPTRRVFVVLFLA